jgi:hypothetical protein
LLKVEVGSEVVEGDEALDALGGLVEKLGTSFRNFYTSLTMTEYSQLYWFKRWAVGTNRTFSSSSEEKSEAASVSPFILYYYK